MSQSALIKRILIVGGGTAGWMTAAAMGKLLAPLKIDVTLLESDQIGTVGVGEATLPHIRFFNRRLGIDEADFMAQTAATFKLGIEFRDWARKGDAYIHPFGDYGRDIKGVPFHHYWLRLRQRGRAWRIGEFSAPVMISEFGRFAMPVEDERSVMSSFSYAYQFDAGLYAKYLRRFAEACGVRRIEGKITTVIQRGEDGFIEAVKTEDGRRVEADLFVDCSGFRGLLIEQTLKAGFEDWSAVLPCDRAVAVPCENAAPSLPYTRATARGAGWQWRIPLQHRVGNGYVYCSEHVSDDEAAQTLMASLEGRPRAEPNFLRFRAGKRRRQWVKNCVSIGLSSGFLEPLESTSIYLIQASVTKLLELFPDRDFRACDIDEFNRAMDLEYERIRDFLILHYHATERDDTPFWDYVRTMKIPDSLAYKMTLFRKRGVVVKYKDGLFLHPSWIAVYLGQRVMPDMYDPRAEFIAEDELEKTLSAMRNLIRKTAESLPDHSDFIRRYCPAPGTV
ncbi:tryptophan halogenase family protein [Amphiplicatus metriothermophilus]|uniref:Tryptophan halogenase n=1 Tax=Amphiplicatus metriothermophilus TaxID=1519374 RepID=A0A239PY70_9PROT|nr:tryptophan halogenase family protein [Amphiplicatus metriothermophilus]MBB5518991.1 tryptophan halogenase [Amphiplicatus metriothermophilus]SNT74607.1 tryptophan halogenase [Amphiplicatus metriothermophilus]